MLKQQKRLNYTNPPLLSNSLKFFVTRNDRKNIKCKYKSQQMQLDKVYVRNDQKCVSG